MYQSVCFTRLHTFPRGSPCKGYYLAGNTCRRQHDRPRVCLANPLKGLTLLQIRECLTFSSCKRMSAWDGRDKPQRSFQCVAYTLRPVSDEISHFFKGDRKPLSMLL